MYKKDTVHNVTQLKQYDVQKKHTVHNVWQCKKKYNYVQKNMLYIMCHNVKK